MAGRKERKEKMMLKILERVNKLLVENKVNKGQDDTAVQERVDLLAILIERAKKNMVVIKITGASNMMIKIAPLGIDFRSVLDDGSVSHDIALELARSRNTAIASVLGVALRDEAGITIL